MITTDKLRCITWRLCESCWHTYIFGGHHVPEQRQKTWPHAAQGMDFTTDKLRSMVRKWQTLIEAHVDVKTTDGYLLRMFCIAFTKKRQQQVKKTCYAQTSQIRQIRRKMVELMTREAAACDLKELVGKFIPEAIGAQRPPVPRPCNGLTCAQLA